MQIKYFNRHSGQVEKEQVYGEGAIKWLYQSSVGKLVTFLLAGTRVGSHIYGALQSSRFSKCKVLPFINKFNINMEDFLPQEGRSEDDPYATFNHFFIRRFRKGRRSFTQASNLMPAFCEARYFGYREVSDSIAVPVKGKYLSAKGLLGKNNWSDRFSGGPMLIARLCPVDYHRFHFPVDCKKLDSYRVQGSYHSVNPMALKAKGDIFISNERCVTILDAKDFGKLAYIEVGALCVGKITQTYQSENFSRGDEKGYFLFGGSTVVLMGEPSSWIPEKDILEYSDKGIETYVQLGNPVARLKA